jgi:hypothetical protein
MQSVEDERGFGTMLKFGGVFFQCPGMEGVEGWKIGMVEWWNGGMVRWDM